MITKIGAENRHYTDHGWLKTFWLFSFSNYYDETNMDFGSLRVFNDDIIEPGTGFSEHPHDKMEIVTIILRGKLTHKDNIGNETVISTGEIQRMSAGEGVIHSEYNRHEIPVHLYQIWFYPNQKTKTGYEQKNMNFKKEELTILADEKGKGVITIKTDATIFQLNLKKGDKINYKIKKNNGLFVYITLGSLYINNIEYNEGDQARIVDESNILFLAKDDIFAILIDVKI